MIGILLGLITFGILYLLFKPKTPLLEKTNYGTNVNTKPLIRLILIFVLSLLLAIFQPISVQRIDAGNVGLKIDRIGNDKGVPMVRKVKGWIFYNSWTTDVVEYSIRQKHVEYPSFETPSKGGTLIPVAPSFNISLKPESATEVYIHLTKSEDAIESIQNSWLSTATNIALTNATNLFTPDSIFNNADVYRIEVEKQLKKQLERYFVIDQIKPGQQPPKSMIDILQAKANAIQAAQQAELNRLTAVANAGKKIAEARGDSASLVIGAKADAEAIKEKTREISPVYVDYVRATRWNGVYPTHVLGSNTSMFLK